MAKNPLGHGAGSGEVFAPYLARGCWVVSLLFVGGTLVDLGILWFAQRLPTVQWEFVATSRTAEGIPRLVLGVVFVYAALYFGGSTSAAGYRITSTLLALLGVVGGVLGFLVITDYFALKPTITAESREVFQSAVAKISILSVLYVTVLIPVGVLGMRAPKRTDGPD